MNLFRILVHTPWAKALGWTVFHFLWEGALLALILAVVLLALRPARVRYAAGCAAMVAMLLAFGFTFARQLAREEAPAPIAAPRVLVPTASPETGSGANPSVARASDLLPWLAPFWIAGVLLFHLRALAAWFGVRRLRRRGVCRALDEWQAQLALLAARLRIARPIVLLESSLTQVPIVLGYLRPVILMPVGLLAGLPAAQVEAILIHELAHIRRHDYLLNLLQTVAESLLFFHPAIWWISGVVRAEREHCCDDCVLALQGNPRAYALALAQLEHNRSAARSLAMAATGGPLVKRIRRLLDRNDAPRVAWTPLVSVTLLLVTFAAVMAAFQTRAPQPAPAAAAPQTVAQAQAQRPLEAKRVEKLRKVLETPYRKWLAEDVAYIITDEERAAFDRLQTDPERERFIEQFWTRRDPTPNTVENEYKEEHYRRIAYSNEHYASTVPGWKTDRGRIYITYGPPDEIESHPAGSQSKPYPYEQWLYHLIPGIGANVIVEFADEDRTGNYRMTRDPNSLIAGTFYSTEPGQPVTLVLRRDGSRSIGVPLGLPAGQYKITATTRTSAGQPIDAFERTEPSCSEPACRVSLTAPARLPAGVYVTTVTVEGSPSSPRKTYTISFTVQ